MIDTVKKCIVQGLTLGRAAAGICLPIAGWQHMWLLAAVLFLGGFISDMLDGALARRWQITTKLGAWLDEYADVVLMAGGVTAVTWGGIWPWWVVVALAAGRSATMLSEPRSYGLMRAALAVLHLGSFMLIALVLAICFVQRATGIAWSYATFGATGAALAIAYAKRDRVRYFAQVVADARATTRSH